MIWRHPNQKNIDSTKAVDVSVGVDVTPSPPTSLIKILPGHKEFPLDGVGLERKSPPVNILAEEAIIPNF